MLVEFPGGVDRRRENLGPVAGIPERRLTVSGRPVTNALKMTCRRCGAMESAVVSVGFVVEADAIRRRRECAACGNRFTTFERTEPDAEATAEPDRRRA